MTSRLPPHVYFVFSAVFLTQIPTPAEIARVVLVVALHRDRPAVGDRGSRRVA